MSLRTTYHILTCKRRDLAPENFIHMQAVFDTSAFIYVEIDATADSLEEVEKVEVEVEKGKNKVSDPRLIRDSLRNVSLFFRLYIRYAHI